MGTLFLNICMSDIDVFIFCPNPIRLARSFFLIVPRFSVPITTEPRPGIVNALSMGIRNGASKFLVGVGI